ncbi:MAG: protein kinase [Candidatus Binatia bacterium]|nr:protein kinase [Candidatus Binatia bacterium]
MNESTLRKLLGTDLAEASGSDLRGTLGAGVTLSDTEADVDPDALTLVLDGQGVSTGEDGIEPLGESHLIDTGYELVEEVGRGGMNVVFRARQMGLEREVAVKRLRSKRRASRSARWAFLSEAAVTAQLDHPNVISIYGMSVDAAGDVALAMKLMRGKSWSHRLRQDFAGHEPGSPPPKLDENLQVLLGVANAIAFAHSRGVLHRDLKPENVMIGDFGEVLVVDWGLAVRFSDTDMGVRAPHKSGVRRTAGTPVYMAPEMVEATGDGLGPWTDVYLLGGLLHEILTGRPPHKGSKLLDVLLSAFDSSPPIFAAEVPVELQDVCRRALAREPADRYATVVEFRDAVREYLAHSESLRICQRSALRLAEARETLESGIDVENRAQVYSELRDVIAGFAAARDVWDENRVATEGESDARLLLAQSALEMGELGTAESALRGQSSDEAETLRVQIGDTALTRERTLRTTRHVSVSLLLLQLAIGLALAFWGFFELRAYHHEVEVAELKRLTPLAALIVKGARTTDSAELNPLIARIVRDMASQGPLRLTVTDPSGDVVADSEADPSELPNHATRPEFIAAARLGAGTSTRMSNTLHEEMVYFALPVRDAAGEPILFVRAALPLDFVTTKLRALVAAVGVSFLVSIVAMCLVTMLLTRHLTRAIERIR